MPSLALAVVVIAYFVCQMGSAEGRSPFAGGTPIVWATDLSPVVGFIPPFLARKGDGGMVETAARRRRHESSERRSEQGLLVGEGELGGERSRQCHQPFVPRD